MSLFGRPYVTPADFDKRLNPPDLHEDDSCESCHREHVAEGKVPDNALDWPAQYPCCVDAFGEMVEKGLICMRHPRAYFEPATKDRKAYCEGCEAEPGR